MLFMTLSVQWNDVFCDQTRLIFLPQADDRDEGEFGTVTYELSGSSVYVLFVNAQHLQLHNEHNTVMY